MSSFHALAVFVLVQVAAVCLSSTPTMCGAELVPGFRPPAIPLIALSPNVAVWLRGDRLTDQTPTFWYSRWNSTLAGYLRVDGTTYRFLGLDHIAQTFATTLQGHSGVRPGNDLPGSPVHLGGGTQASDCALLCDTTKGCAAWTWYPSQCGGPHSSMCYLKAEVQPTVADACAVSDLQAVLLPNSSLDGLANTDGAGADITTLYIPNGTPRDCSMQCYQTVGCDLWIFSHDGCDWGQPHCDLKYSGSTFSPYPNDCRRSGTGPYSAGWVPPSTPVTPTLEQVELVVTPTRTMARFTGAGVELLLTFMQPALPHDIITSAREHAYIIASVHSTDGALHSVQLYLDAATDIVVNSADDPVVWKDVSAAVQQRLPSAHVLTMQPFNTMPFGVRGDFDKPNWINYYLATSSLYFSNSTQAVAGPTRQAFVSGQPLPPTDTRQPRASNDDMIVSAFTFDLGKVGPRVVEVQAVFLVDEQWPMYYFRQLLTPYVQHVIGDWSQQVVAALQDYGSLLQQTTAYDTQLLRETTELVGDKYSTLLALIHRQVLGSTLVVWNEERQTPWLFLKEMSTGGDVSTMDVVYPAAPFYIALAPEALRLLLLPLLAYSNNETDSHYDYPWAPHHLGAWPVCDIVSSQQEQMPIEESANFIIMLAAIAQRQAGQVDYLQPYRLLLDTWAQYINISLPDPEQQLCTDDFEGPSPHNANLALKGIVGLNAYAILLRYFGQFSRADAWDALAASLAQDWIRLAIDHQPGTLKHYKQRYDQNGTWSTKYNLIWQYILGTSSFPDDVRVTENAYYQTQAMKYGIPLDNRHSYQKSDWFSWMGALAFDNATQQSTIIDFLYHFANTSPSRVPFTDLFDVTNNQATGEAFTARAVMGGLYSMVLTNARGRAHGREVHTRGGLESIEDVLNFASPQHPLAKRMAGNAQSTQPAKVRRLVRGKT